MSGRKLGLVFCFVLTVPVAANAKDKKKEYFPLQILQAHSIAVIIAPGSEVPLANPGENRDAVGNVQKALMRWGRFRLEDPANSDLLVVVRKGRAAGPVITTQDSDPTTINRSDAGIYIGGRQGTPPDLGGTPPQRGPRVVESMGPAEDAFLVYAGRGLNPHFTPLDGPALWRMTGKKILDGPAVPAVAAFRKAIEKQTGN